MAQLLGDWKLVSSENFDEAMKAMGVGFAMRQVGKATKPNIKFTQNGDEWVFTTTSTLKTTTVTYKLDQWFDEETADGRKVKSCFVMDGNKLVQTQKDKDGNVVCVITREIIEGGQLKATVTVGDVVATRIYDKDH